jgi:hypothetical protein
MQLRGFVHEVQDPIVVEAQPVDRGPTLSRDGAPLTFG